MDRRRFCAAMLAGAAAGLSGCGSAPVTGSDPPATGRVSRTPSSERRDSTATAVSLARLGNPPDICAAEVVEDFTIKAIVDPAFGDDWVGYDIDAKYRRTEDAEPLDDVATVVGREHDGRARAYPLSVLWYHEVVNDVLGPPLIVTYCSICRSGLVADRRLDGAPTRFGVSGHLWHPPDRYISASARAGRSFGAARWNASDIDVREGPNLVMYDELTRSFWSQAIGQAICGPLTGTRLSVLPSTVTTWADWRTIHPETKVLLPPPHSRVDD